MTLSVLLAFIAVPCVCAARQPVSTTAPSSRLSPPQELSDWLEIVFAPSVGGGFDTGSPRELSGFGGIKVGAGVLPLHRHNGRERYRTVTLDLGYDRIRSYSGFSAELSVMLPIVQWPKPQADPRSNYLRIYGEPGVGYRMGGGPFGGYASAKVMVAVLSDARLGLNRPSPFVEVQRRFSIPAMSEGDTRIVVGLMFALCNHCGVD
jgi:hypothetical protein